MTVPDALIEIDSAFGSAMQGVAQLTEGNVAAARQEFLDAADHLNGLAAQLAAEQAPQA